MIGEIDIYGVFVSPLVVWIVIALPSTAALRRILARAGIYRFVWHRPVFDLALLVMMVGAVVRLSSLLPTMSLWSIR
jgi:hypothetical protein